MSASLLLWGVLFSSVGVGYFIYGKKQDRRVPMFCGIGLMVFPYFIANVYLLVVFCGALLALPYFLRR